MGPLVPENVWGSAERKKENKEEKRGKEKREKEKKQLPLELSSFFCGTACVHLWTASTAWRLIFY